MLISDASPKKRALIVLCGQAVLFGIALVLPAGVFARECPNSNGSDQILGGMLFLWGPFGMVLGLPAAYPWLANLTLGLGTLLLFFGKNRSAAVPAVLTAGGALLFLPLARMYPFAADEGGVCYHRLALPHIGYALWVMVALLPMVGLAVRRRAQHASEGMVSEPHSAITP